MSKKSKTVKRTMLISMPGTPEIKVTADMRTFEFADGEVRFHTSKVWKTYEEAQKELDHFLNCVERFVDVYGMKPESGKTASPYTLNKEVISRALADDVDKHAIIDVIDKFNDKVNKRVTSSETYADGAPESENSFWLDAAAGGIAASAQTQAGDTSSPAVKPTSPRESKMTAAKETIIVETQAGEGDIPENMRALSAKITPTISIDPETGVATYNDIKFEDTLSATPGLTMENVEATLNHLDLLAGANTHALGHLAVKVTTENHALAKVHGFFPGPGRAKLAVSYKVDRKTAENGKGPKITHATVTTSWKDLGGPSGKAYEAVRNSIKAAAELNQDP